MGRLASQIWSQNVPEHVLVFFRFWFLNMPTFHLSQYFYDICLIFMQTKTLFEPQCVCFCPVANHFTEKHSISSLGYEDFLPKHQHITYQNVQQILTFKMTSCPVETSTDEGTKGLKRREGYSNGNFLIWIESFLTGWISKSDLIIQSSVMLLMHTSQMRGHEQS